MFTFCNVVPTLERRAQIVSEVATAVQDLCWSRKFVSPSCSKWTRSGPFLDQMLLVCMCGNLRHISRLGLMPLEFTEKVQSVYGEMDSTHIWNQVNGRYKKRFDSIVNDTDRLMSLMINVVVLEPDRLLSLLYMKFAHGAPRVNSGQEPPITILTNPRCSPIRQCLSYHAGLLQLKSGRLVILAVLRGCRSVVEWLRQFPQDALVFRQMVSSSAASLQRRQRNLLESGVWPLFSTLHSRMDSAEALQICQRFLDTADHRLHPGVRRLKHQILAVLNVDHASLLFHRLLEAKVGAFIIHISVAPIENLHSLHRRAKSHSQQVPTLSTLAAKSVTHQFRSEYVRSKMQCQPIENKNVASFFFLDHAPPVFHFRQGNS